MHAFVSNRVGICFMVIIETVSFCIGPAMAQAESDFSKAIQLLANEQSLAESYAFILHEFGKEDLSNYATGIRLYADAKAKFDGLIEQLKYDVRSSQSPAASTTLDIKLNQAAKHWVAFTDFVTEEIIRDDPGKKNPVIIAGIAAAPDLIKALSEVGKTIWQEYRDADQQQKQEILDQLESMKWKGFSEIVG